MFAAALILSMRLAPFPTDHRAQLTNGVCPVGVHVEICEVKKRHAFFIKLLHVSPIA